MTILIVVLLALVLGPASASNVGDVDCSGIIDSRDAAVLLQVHTGLAEPGFCYYWNADLDFDGDQDSRDALLVLFSQRGEAAGRE